MRRCSFCQMPGPECRAGVCESSRLAKACGWTKSERSLWICIHCTRTYRGRIDFEAVAAATQGLCLLCAQAGAEALHTNIATSVCSSRPAITLVLGAQHYVTGCSCTQHTDIDTYGGRCGTAEALTAPLWHPTTFPAAAIPASAHRAVPAPGDALAAGVAAAAAVPVVATSSDSAFLSPAAASSAASEGLPAALPNVRVVEASSAEHMSTASLKHQCPLTEAQLGLQYGGGAKLWSKIGGRLADVKDRPPADLPRFSSAGRGLKTAADPEARQVTAAMAMAGPNRWEGLSKRRRLTENLYQRAHTALCRPQEVLGLSEGE